MAADVLKEEIKVLIVDDSAYNRRALSEFFAGVNGVRVVGKACDGEEALRLALAEKPDAITLDLEMPRLDGFSFLRILMAKQPTPVIVISSFADPDNVFRALELGAIDFIAKPTHRISPAIQQIRDEVVAKIQLAVQMKKEGLRPVLRGAAGPLPTAAKETPKTVAAPSRNASDIAVQRNAITAGLDEASIPYASGENNRKVVVIAASTGGPPALTRLLSALPATLAVPVIIAQHMPAGFTKSFAERLDRHCSIRVKEVDDSEPLVPGIVYVAPGDACVEVAKEGDTYRVLTVPPDMSDRYIPSADRLFKSVASTFGSGALAIVLTGMGDDGAAGVNTLAAAGAEVIAEDESTAVIPGMPRAAINTGGVTQVVPLDHIGQIIIRFAHIKPR